MIIGKRFTQMRYFQISVSYTVNQSQWAGAGDGTKGGAEGEGEEREGHLYPNVGGCGYPPR